jgi:hypothetical protein
VNEVNTTPSLAAIENKTVQEEVSLTFTVTATDSDLPAQKLAFSLEAGAPAGAAITSEGVFSWTPAEAQGPSTNTVTVKVTDNGSPALSETRSFTIVVKTEPMAPHITIINRTSENWIKVTWTSEPGIAYKLQQKHLLGDAQWTDVDQITAIDITTSITDTRGMNGQTYYRVEALTSP